MITNYKSSVVSPFQIKKPEFDISDREHPVQTEIRKNIGTFSLTVEISEDKATLESFKHVPGLIAFKCSLKKGPELIGIGHGSSVVSRINKYLERTVRFAYAESIKDAVGRSAKIMDAIYLSNNQQNSNDIEPATEKQKKYLLELLQSADASEEECEKVLSLSKDEASDRINFLVTSR
jgi:hypothetical protein